MTERELLEATRTAATLAGWLVYHTRDSRGSEAGFPDLVLVHPGKGRLVFAELKGSQGRTSPGQHRWLDALARLGGPSISVDPDGETRIGPPVPEVYLWRPADWESRAILEVLQ